MTIPLLRLENASYFYPGSLQASIRDVTLSLLRENIVSFEGDNASGKSTLGLVLTGAAPNCIGGRLEGTLLKEGKPLDSADTRAGLVFQNPFLYFLGTTIEEESAYILNRRFEFLEVACTVTQERGPTTPLAELSLGQQQLVALASALLSRKPVVVLDEPFAWLSTHLKALANRLIRDARDDGCLVILLTGPYGSGSNMEGCDDTYIVVQGTVLRKLHTGIESFDHRVRDLRPLSQFVPGTSREQSSILSATDLSFRYSKSGRPAVNNVSLSILRGECVGIVGENGAGKSTLLHLLGGLRDPVDGKILVNDTEADGRVLRGLTKCALQNPDFQIANKSVYEELAFGLLLAGCDKNGIPDRINEMGPYLPFALKADPFTLSFGQRKLLTIISVFVLKPMIVLLDEPLTGLDFRNSTIVQSILGEFLCAGGAAAVTGHDQTQLSVICHRNVWLVTED